MIKNEIEIWKSHPDIVGIEVSTLGRVRTLDRVVSSEKRTQFVKGRVLKQHNDNDNGYLHVGFRINGKKVSKNVHRLVAETFIDNPNVFTEVNHLDCNKTNNHVKNLEWCTTSYNAKYREKFGISNTETLGLPMFAISLSTLEVSHFRSQGEASRKLGVNRQNINSVISGRYKYTHGFWFVNDDGHAVDVVKSKLHDIGGTGLKIKCRAFH